MICILFYRNGFYGDQWASLMHREMQEWLLQGDQPEEREQNATCEEGELPVERSSNQISNLIETVYEHEQKQKEPETEVSESGKELPPKSALFDRKALDPLKRRLVYDINPKVLFGYF